MKHTLRALAFTLISVLVAVLVARGRADPIATTGLTLLGGSVSPIGTPLIGDSPPYVLQLLGVSSFETNIQTTTEAELHSLFSTFRLRDGSHFAPTNVVSACIFSDAPMVTQGAIPDNTLLGASVFEYDGVNNPTHRYFERRRGTMVELTQFSVQLNGSYTTDTTLMMHFAATAKNGMPPQSAMYEFNSDRLNDWPVSFEWIPIDQSIERLVLQDSDRSSGARFLGLTTNAALESVLGGATLLVDRRCGNDRSRSCPVGDELHCKKTADKKYECWNDVEPPSRCSANDVQYMCSIFGLQVSIPFAQLWEFRDEFLMQYSRGVTYKNYYYLFSMSAKKDFASIVQFVEFMPHASEAVEVLMHGSSTDTVITPSLFSAAMTIIQNHRDVEDPLLQDLLDVVEGDLNNYTGLGRAAFLEQFAAEQ